KASRLPPGMPPCPTSKRPGAFNAHNPGDGGSGLVQPVFRSPARIPAAESTPEDCAPRRQAKNSIRYRLGRSGAADLDGSAAEVHAKQIQQRMKYTDTFPGLD